MVWGARHWGISKRSLNSLFSKGLNFKGTEQGRIYIAQGFWFRKNETTEAQDFCLIFLPKEGLNTKKRFSL